MSSAMYGKVSSHGKGLILSNGANHPIIGFGTYKAMCPPIYPGTSPGR
jgi:hypothetical protein